VIWVLLDTDGELIVAGPWRSIVELGEEEGLIVRRHSEHDGSETAPRMAVRGLTFAPLAMFPHIHVETD
jgi:hypothetical protein